MLPIVMGPPAYGSPDPITAGFTLTTIEDMPEMQQIVDAPEGEGGEQQGVQILPAGGGETVQQGGEAAAPTGLATLSQEQLYDVATTYNITQENGDEVTEDMTKEELLAVIDPELEDMLKADLTSIAEMSGLEVASSDTKADIINKLRGKPTAAEQQQALQPDMGTPTDTASTHGGTEPTTPAEGGETTTPPEEEQPEEPTP
jgi:hypothetical protein